jgi:hypothetical protein
MGPYEIDTETDGVKVRVFEEVYGVAFDITWGGDDDWPSAYLNESQTRNFMMILAHRYNKKFPAATCKISFELNEECE